MHTIPNDGMDHPAEWDHLAGHMHVECEFSPCKCSLDRESGGGKNDSVLRVEQERVTRFVIMEPSCMFRLPHPAPPPKRHYSTWWRSVTRRLYRAKASSVLKKLQADVHEQA
jgi:hypothetical protein